MCFYLLNFKGPHTFATDEDDVEEVVVYVNSDGEEVEADEEEG